MGQNNQEEPMPEDNDPKNAIGYIPSTRSQDSEEQVHPALTPKPVEMTLGEAAKRMLRRDMRNPSQAELAKIREDREKKDREDSSS